MTFDDDDDDDIAPADRVTLRSVPRIADRAREVIAAEQEARSRRLSDEDARHRRDFAEHRAHMMLERTHPSKIAVPSRDEGWRPLVREVAGTAAFCFVVFLVLTVLVLWIGGAL